MSNLRTAYAQAQTAVLTEESDTANGVTYAKAASAAVGPTVKVENVVSKGTQAGYSGDVDKELPFAAPKAADNGTSMDNSPNKYDVTFTYDANLKITTVAAAVHQ